MLQEQKVLVDTTHNGQKSIRNGIPSKADYCHTDQTTLPHSPIFYTMKAV